MEIHWLEPVFGPNLTFRRQKETPSLKPYGAKERLDPFSFTHAFGVIDMPTLLRFYFGVIIALFAVQSSYAEPVPTLDNAHEKIAALKKFCHRYEGDEGNAKECIQAKKLAEATLKQDPDNINLLFDFAMMMSYTERPKAVNILKKVVALDPDHVEGLYYLGAYLNGKEAVKYLKKAIQLDPSHRWAHHFLAYELLEMGDGAGAAKAMKNHIKHDYVDTDIISFANHLQSQGFSSEIPGILETYLKSTSDPKSSCKGIDLYRKQYNVKSKISLRPIRIMRRKLIDKKGSSLSLAT
jgi:tetratricopeptide (TPR) repeat protein